MSFIYSLQAFWNNNSQVFNGIDINISNGLGGNPIYASGSKFLNLLKNSTSVFSIDPNGNLTLLGSITGSSATFSGNISADTFSGVNATFSGTMNATTVSQGGIPIKKVLINPTYYFSTTGNDDNNGTSPTTPKLTLQTWWQTLFDSYIIVGQLKFQLADGVYDQQLQMNSDIQGILSRGSFVIQGNLTDRTAVVIRPSLGANAKYCISGNDTRFSVRCMTLDGSLIGSVNGSDRLVVAGDADVSASSIRFIGNAVPNGCNDISHFLGSTLVIDGDIDFSTGYRQVGIYTSDSSQLYLNINNTNSVSRTGNFSLGSSSITLTVALPAGYGPNNIVRGTGIPENARIGTIDGPRTGITIVDVEGTPIVTTGAGPQTLTIGGMYFNFLSSPIFGVSMLFGTLNPTVNMQGIQATGTFTGQSIVYVEGAKLDFGVSPLSTLPGTIPQYIDGLTSAGFKNDSGGSSQIIPIIAGGIISGQKSTGITTYQFWGAGPSVSSSVILFNPISTNQFQFYGSDAGNMLWDFAGEASSSIRVFKNSATNVDGRLIATAGAVQFGSISNDPLELLSNNSAAVYVFPSTGVAINTNNDPGAGQIYTNSATNMIRTKTSYTDHSAGNVGTLNNAPAAGNPTKWIQIDDNGTARFIPAW